ncbi:MAG TPA: ATP-binding protein, partial [Chitinophagaceae bacterium]|nr:ATP-binding protein [Chitinophagaceae bacterium]
TPFRNSYQHQFAISVHNGVLYCDRQGITWSGKWLREGIYQIIPLSKPVSSYLADTVKNEIWKNIVINCIKAGNGKVWMGSAHDGIIQFEPQENRLEYYLPQEKIPGAAKEDRYLIPVMVDTLMRKALLRSDDYLLHELDIATKKVFPVRFIDSSLTLVKPSKIFTSSPFRNGCIISAEFEEKAAIFWVQTGSLKANLIMSFPKTSINGNRTATNGNSLLFFKRPEALGNLSYTFRDNQWALFPSALDSISWDKIFYNDADSSWWVIIPRELLHFDKKLRLTRRYSKQDGLPSLEIIALINDNDGNVWFNTNRNIYRLNLETGIISGLTEKDGFQPRDFRQTIFGAMKFDNGDLYFPGGGTAQGFQVVHPDKYKLQPAAVYLKSIDVKGYTLPLSLGVNNIHQLTLKYFQNRVMIETGTLDYYSKGKGHIRYRLSRDGSQENWLMAPANYTIRYEELPAGEYSLQIQAGNEGGEFNGPVKTLMITIRPAFWNTWWFRVAAIVFVLALLFGIIQYRSRYLKERNLVLEEKVTQRTNELNNSLAELKATQDQLIHSEKMASLGELTSGIAHEIKNPLNFINNFSEINMELMAEMEEEQPNKDERDQMMKTLKKNLEKINHHGKRVDEIVKGMLQHSRLGNVNKEAVNINSLCEESLKLAYHGFKAKEKTFNASFEKRFDPDLPNVMAIPQDMGRVLLNLFNNAFYAVNEKKKKIQSNGSHDALQTESLYKPSVIVSTKKAGNKISITVSDNGMGIPSPIINKIFQPFFTTKPTGEGTGLGLSMSYDIIAKSHGGELQAKSKEGLGTDFEIILPI